MSIAVVIPTLNEAGCIAASLRVVGALNPPPETICVDGGSADDTATLARQFDGVHVLQASRGRALQMNAGASVASAEWLLFLHADTHLAQTAWNALQDAMANPEVQWGWFDVRFDISQWAYRAHAWLISRRARISGSPTGDQAMFVRKSLFEAVGGFPEVPLMEDVALTRSLRRRAHGTRVAAAVVTSARRWQRHGLLRTIVRMWLLKVQYLAGRDPRDLADAYPHVR